MGAGPVPLAGHRRLRALDFRAALRRFFEVDRHYVVVAALSELAAEGAIDAKVVAEAIAKYDIDVEAPMPTTV